MLALATLGAQADPGYYVVTPYDRAGQSTVDLRYWTFKRSGKPEVIWPEWALGHGVNTRWTTTVLASYLGYVGAPEKPMRLSTLNWQNVVMLTQGEWPVDVALYGAWIRSMDDAFKHALEWGPMLQTDVGRTQLNLNLMFERRAEATGNVPVQLKYQWQAKHRLYPGWQAGIQGFGELGTWNDWNPRALQSHRLGPAVFGQVHGEGQQVLEWHAALLWGSTNARQGHMVSVRAAYSF